MISGYAVCSECGDKYLINIRLYCGCCLDDGICEDCHKELRHEIYPDICQNTPLIT